MGGRGAASGVSDGKPYGSEYHSLDEFENIKFVASNDASNTAPLETMTKGRVYAIVNESNNKIKAISFYDESNKRYKQIDLDHYHKINGKSEKPHVQMGYYHNGAAYKPSEKEKALIDKVEKFWYSKKASHS